MEANLCNRYRMARGACTDLSNPTLRKQLGDLFTPSSSLNSFPKRARGDTYKLVGSDLENYTMS
jgi:hypothetical protein